MHLGGHSTTYSTAPHQGHVTVQKAAGTWQGDRVFRLTPGAASASAQKGALAKGGSHHTNPPAVSGGIPVSRYIRAQEEAKARRPETRSLRWRGPAP